MSVKRTEEVLYFANSEAFRSWLETNHLSCEVLWVGYHKKNSGTPSITWPESVDQALCFNWIDGLRHPVDEKRYKIRFTPRKKDSNWSDVNIRRIKELHKAGLVRPAAWKAFNERRDSIGEHLTSEQREDIFTRDHEEEFRKHPKAWKYFDNLAPSYKKISIWWVISAKREETRKRRLQVLIECSEKGKKIPALQGNR